MGDIQSGTGDQIDRSGYVDGDLSCSRHGYCFGAPECEADLGALRKGQIQFDCSSSPSGVVHFFFQRGEYFPLLEFLI